ncbi:hypothetical protein Rhe02_19580 [Rhizocola hellebori]|uniref:Uncharacterized protein n=1 Tax=Rhizocola hellebori TaxID=1392758 RepID=A0A8J3Q5W2_9ACTN|nr:hypothetical protein [Rhizocola hellebori]GIH03891.1 hypothetical protein Rhe02_19580 [Rhizocola hellebori]
MFFEIVGREPLPEHLDRDDLEDATRRIAAALNDLGVGWVTVRQEAWLVGRPASELVR